MNKYCIIVLYTINIDADS